MLRMQRLAPSYLVNYPVASCYNFLFTLSLINLITLFFGRAEVDALLARDVHDTATYDAHVVCDEPELSPVVDAALLDPIVQVAIDQHGAERDQTDEELCRAVQEVSGEKARRAPGKQEHIHVQHHDLAARHVSQERTLVLRALVQYVRGEYEVDTDQCLSDAPHLGCLLSRCVQHARVQDEEARHADHPMAESNLSGIKVKVCSDTAQYSVRRTAQSVLHFTGLPLADLCSFRHQNIQPCCNYCTKTSLTFPPSAVYSKVLLYTTE